MIGLNTIRFVFFKLFIVLAFGAFTLPISATETNLAEESGEVNHYIKLKEMFSEMVVKKNAALIPHYYHPEFLLYSNGKTMDYEETVRFHEKIYQTSIQYKIDYDEQTALYQDNKVAVRMYITTSKPGENENELELILIAHFKDGKIYRVWELTYPDWSQDNKFHESLKNL